MFLSYYIVVAYFLLKFTPLSPSESVSHVFSYVCELEVCEVGDTGYQFMPLSKLPPKTDSKTTPTNSFVHSVDTC